MIIIAICSFNIAFLFAQPAKGQLSILVYTGEEPLEFVTVRLPDLGLGGYTDSLGKITFSHFPAGDYALELFRTGYFAQKITVSILPGKPEMIKVELLPQALREVVVTGTMKAVSRSESPVPVEIITPQLFRRNPSPNLFNAVSMVSGVQPVIGCNVCNTGDIHINGMEGPYTMILLDGMPIVSGLGTVYGLMGIPNSLIERVEVVKGPAAALYGSEAMAGMINVITRSPLSSPRLSIDVFSSSWGEVNADFGGLFRVGEKAKSLLGINVFNYSLPQDKNADGFTDLTLEKRISVFNKWAFKRHSGKIANLAFRAIGENRWGGEMNWTPAFGGGDSIYGEHIITRRLESFGTWQWPSKANIFTQYSLVSHRQQSVYGTLPFNAGQDIGFLQNYWEQTFKNHSTLLGIALRWNGYDDNTPATAHREHTLLPGLFVQDEWKIAPKLKLLGGFREDYHSKHGLVSSPRFAVWHQPNLHHTFRLSTGTGFRVVQLFTEDHAALTGARTVVIAEALRPEQSWGSNANWNWKIPRPSWFLTVDMNAFYTRFSNRITADYDADPQLIIYDNLHGKAITRGITATLDYSDYRPLKVLTGVTFMEVFQSEKILDQTSKIQQLHAPKWSGNWSVNYSLLLYKNRAPVVFDFTGNWYGPQRLPVLPNDFRPAWSPWFSILNFQVSHKTRGGIEWYGGVKNILNFVPQNPIMRPFDPFDKTVDDPVNNPNGYTFDPSYNYAPLQGIRGFLGLRWNKF